MGEAPGASAASAEGSKVQISIKWSGQEFQLQLAPEESVASLKRQLEGATAGEGNRQVLAASLWPPRQAGWRPRRSRPACPRPAPVGSRPRPGAATHSRRQLHAA